MGKKIDLPPEMTDKLAKLRADVDRAESELASAQLAREALDAKRPNAAALAVQGWPHHLEDLDAAVRAADDRVMGWSEVVTKATSLLALEVQRQNGDDFQGNLKERGILQDLRRQSVVEVKDAVLALSKALDKAQRVGSQGEEVCKRLGVASNEFDWQVSRRSFGAFINYSLARFHLRMEIQDRQIREEVRQLQEAQ